MGKFTFQAFIDLVIILRYAEDQFGASESPLPEWKLSKQKHLVSFDKLWDSHPVHQHNTNTGSLSTRIDSGLLRISCTIALNHI